jgi:hypothetical protein
MVLPFLSIDGPLGNVHRRRDHRSRHWDFETCEGYVMKGLTLTQPWATLIAIGAKRIETRSWSTSYRGPIAIHAAKGLGPVGGQRGLFIQCAAEPFRTVLSSAIESHSPPYAGNLKRLCNQEVMPLGSIVATANLVHCLPTNGGYFKMSIGNFELQNGRITSGEVAAVNYEKPAAGTNEFAFGDYSPNRYMWFLEDVKRLGSPIECKGALSLWEVPLEIERLLR